MDVQFSSLKTFRWFWPPLGTGCRLTCPKGGSQGPEKKPKTGRTCGVSAVASPGRRFGHQLRRHCLKPRAALGPLDHLGGRGPLLGFWSVQVSQQDSKRSISSSGTRVLGMLGGTVGLLWALRYLGTRLGGWCGYCRTRAPGVRRVHTGTRDTQGNGGYCACTRNPNPSQPTPHPLPSQMCSLGTPENCRQVHLGRDSVPSTAKGYPRHVWSASSLCPLNGRVGALWVSLYP